MTRGPAATGGWFRDLSDDVVAIVLLVGLANVAVWHPFLSETPVRVLAGMLLILFVPGYALVAALFPARGTSPTGAGSSTQPLASHDDHGQSVDDDHSTTFRGIDRWERLALGFGLSLAIVPLLALGVTLSPYALSLATIFLSVSVFTLLSMGIATVRRRAVPPEQRYHLSVGRWVARTRTGQRRSGSTGHVVLNIALVGAVIFAAGTLGFAVMASPDGEQFTEFHVLSEDADGELVAGEYPEMLVADEPRQIHMGIENEEGHTVEYTVVVQSQRIEETDQGMVVSERVELDRFSVVLESGESWTRAHNLTVPETMTGTDMRIEFLLYRGSVPAETTSATAYRDLHLWVDIQSGATTASADS